MLELTLKFQQYLREKKTSKTRRESYNDYQEKWVIHTDENEIIHKFNDFINQEIADGNLTLN